MGGRTGRHDAVNCRFSRLCKRVYKCLNIIPADGATAWGGPWPPLQYASRSLGSLLYISTRLYPSFSGPWTRHPAISFLVFLFVFLHTAFRTASFFWDCGVLHSCLNLLAEMKITDYHAANENTQLIYQQQNRLKSGNICYDSIRIVFVFRFPIQKHKDLKNT